MRVKYLGEVVREQRKLLGVPQELVCEGLCTAMTLSRFESGRQTPSRDCVVAILQRLGLPDDRYYAQLTKTETRLLHLKKEVLAYCSQFEQTVGEERQCASAKALEKLRTLEHCIREDDHINQQFVLRIKVSLETYSPQKQMEMLMEAIRLTSPWFDIDEFSDRLYSTDEIVIISKIALRYSLCKQRRKAIDIYGQLLKLILKRTPDHSHLPLTAYNYALQLALENRFEEAQEISKLGRRVCIKQKHYYLLPKFLHIEAKCHYLMGKIDESVELFRSAYYVYGATMDTKNQESLKTYAEELFDLVF